PGAAIIFIGENHQWCKASLNLDHRNPSLELLCAKAIRQSQPFMVADPAVETGSGLTGSFAADTLRTPEGLPLGLFCVLDPTPHPFSARQLKHLQALARQAAALLELRGTRRHDEHRAAT